MDANQSAVSWGAIAAGAAAIAALTLVLVALGAALGFSSVSPWPNSGLSAKTFQIATGLYLVFSAMLASTIGGYVSGRLRSKWSSVHTYEVQFRDTAHGFLAWALAIIVGAAALGGTATYLTGTTAASAANATNNAEIDYYVTQLMRPNPLPTAVSGPNPVAPSSTTGPAPQPSNALATREARAILVHGAANGTDLSASDRALLAQLVSARTGQNQTDAEKRVSEVVTRAKAEADRARKAAGSISIWLTISMLVGAFSASLAAVEGGQLRDRRWRGVLWARAYNEAKIET